LLSKHNINIIITISKPGIRHIWLNAITSIYKIAKINPSEDKK